MTEKSLPDSIRGVERTKATACGISTNPTVMPAHASRLNEVAPGRGHHWKGNNRLRLIWQSLIFTGRPSQYRVNLHMHMLSKVHEIC
jgi:hypothetical protein